MFFALILGFAVGHLLDPEPKRGWLYDALGILAFLSAVAPYVRVVR
jgi:hypothetical protein